ncbi:hypothetical protein [Corynebacterium sp. LK2510]|uniref:6PGD fold domain-containing protein n=1 Tax=Corynebacterium sp. LK2510 TaxID=3110472 RepID=UPI0034CD210B
MAPRLQVCLVRDPRSGEYSAVGSALGLAGHSVTEVPALAGTEECDAAREANLVIIDSDDPEWVTGCVDKLEPLTRPKQMVLHTCLAVGVQALDEVEVRGAVTMAAHPIVPDCWVTSATDELGEATLALLVGEMHGMNVSIDDALRPHLVAAARIMALSSTGSRDGLELIGAALPEAGAALAPYMDAAEMTPVVALDPAHLERANSAIADPSLARFHAELERREAERTHNADVQLWATATISTKEQ